MIKENCISITAHAGCMNTEMDSIKAVKAGIKYGADIIEIDLNIDENNNLVLCHNAPEHGKIYVKFEKVLTIIKDNQCVLLNIDVKNTNVLDKLNSIILDYGVEDKVFLTGLSFENINQNKEKLNRIKYFVNLEAPKLDITQLNNEEYLRILLNELETLNIMGININYKFMTLELINACKQKNILSSVWTVDDKEEMRKVISMNVNSITTKRVNILKNMIKENINSGR